MHLVINHADVTAADSVFIAVPEGGTIKKATSCIGSALTGNLAIALEIATVAVTGGSWSVTASGSAAGDIDEVEPTAANVIPADGSVEIIFDGTPSGGTSVTVHLEIQRNV